MRSAREPGNLVVYLVVGVTGLLLAWLLGSC